MVMFIFTWKTESNAQSHWEGGMSPRIWKHDLSGPHNTLQISFVIHDPFDFQGRQRTSVYYNSQSTLVYMLELMNLLMYI